ncbi:hypothetical protein E1J61_16045 [Cupriavidus sp. L7L]|nr:hypothetical protein E1J61_16045 [Cupriavidus sp. L7L]
MRIVCVADGQQDYGRAFGGRAADIHIEQVQVEMQRCHVRLIIHGSDFAFAPRPLADQIRAAKAASQPPKPTPFTKGLCGQLE